MTYKVLVSNGYEADSFYTENKPQADLLFNMAVESKMFSYVELAEVQEECFIKREWEEEEDTEPTCTCCGYQSFITYTYCPECGAKLKERE